MRQDPEGMLHDIRSLAKRLREMDNRRDEVRYGSPEYEMVNGRMVNASRVLVDLINELDGWLMNGGHLPVSWSRPDKEGEVASTQLRQDSAGNVKPGWVLRHNGADRIVRSISIRGRLGESDRPMVMWLDGCGRVDGDENQTVYVVSDDEPKAPCFDRPGDVDVHDEVDLTGTATDRLWNQS